MVANASPIVLSIFMAIVISMSTFHMIIIVIISITFMFSIRAVTRVVVHIIFDLSSFVIFEMSTGAVDVVAWVVGWLVDWLVDLLTIVVVGSFHIVQIMIDSVRIQLIMYQATSMAALAICTMAAIHTLTLSVHVVAMHIVLLILPLVRLVELLEGEDYDEKDDQVSYDAKYPCDSKAVRNIFAITVGIILRPRANIKYHVGHWNEEQKLYKHVPPFFDCTNDDVNNDTNECENDQ